MSSSDQKSLLRLASEPTLCPSITRETVHCAYSRCASAFIQARVTRSRIRVSPVSPRSANSATSRSAAATKRPGLRSSRPRSNPAVAIAIAQPSPGAPTTCSCGTWTSSRKTSANPAWPSSWRIGRTVTPSARSGISTKVRPRWRSESGSVRTRPNIQSA